MWCVAVGAVPAVALDPAKSIDQYGLDVWRTREGLPQNSIQAVIQTHDGYLWLATQEGLVRFDGVRFTVFDRANTDVISNNHMTALLQGRDRSLWVGTMDGLLRLKAGEWTTYSRAQGLDDAQVLALAEDGQGTLWVGTWAGGVARLEGGEFRVLTREQGLPDDRVDALWADPDGVVWAGTRGGLARIEAGRITVYGTSHGLAHPRINALHRDRSGRLWVGTPAGISRLEPGGGVSRFTTRDGLGHDFVRALHEDQHGNVWVATYGGLNRWDGRRFTAMTSREGLSSDAVSALHEDREGSLWVGTDGGGLARLKAGKVTTFTRAHGLSSSAIYAITGDGRGGIWAASYAAGVARFVDGRFVSLPGQEPIQGLRLRAVLEDRRGGLWIGTEKGLFLHRAGTWTTYTTRNGLPNDVIRALHEDRRGRVWIGTDGGGLVSHQAGRFRIFTDADGLGSNDVRVVLEARDGTLWAGTYGGLSRLDGERFRTYRVTEGLADDRVRALHEDADGALWIGTYGGGLSRLKDGAFASFTSRDGLLSDVIYSILEDAQGWLWMSCNRGVFRVSKASLDDFAAGRVRAVESVSYDEADGMKNRECNGGSPGGWQTPDGRLWFPTVEGVAMLDPGRIQPNVTPPPVLIERVIANDRAVSPGARLPPGTDRFEFHYTGLSFTAPDQVRFAYKLEGVDEDWIEAGSRRIAFYTQLDPGNYVFRVIAANEDGVWNRTGAAVAFSLAPHFSQSPWFLAGVGLALVAAAGGYYRFRIGQHQRREGELQERIHEALARIKVLSGLLPICAWCKKVRDDGGYWNQLETYIKDHSQADFTHAICPDCVKQHYPQVAARYEQREGGETG